MNVILVFSIVVILFVILMWLRSDKETYANVDGVTFYQEFDFNGTSMTLGVGQYDISTTLKNDIGSIRVPEGYSVTIYGFKGGSGSSFTTTKSVRSLADIPTLTGGDWNNKVVSVKIGRVEFFTKCNFLGRSAVRGEGIYNNNALEIPNTEVSSIKIPPGYLVTLYELDGFNGETVTFSKDVPCLADLVLRRGTSWKNKAKGIKISRLLDLS